MNTIGSILKNARLKKKISFADLERETKIKKEYLIAFENESWKNLPEYPVLIGFVKNIAGTLDLDKSYAAATLRRDYPPKNLSINPKPDVGKDFVWSPKLTFILGAVLTSLVVISYLLFQYFRFMSPPRLEVAEPKENETVTVEELKVVGVTDPDAVVTVNNQLVVVGDDGKYETVIEVFEGTKEVKVVARSRSGKETSISRMIEVDLENRK